MLTRAFKDIVLRDIDGPIVTKYVDRAKVGGLMDEQGNWAGTSVEETMFLVLIMQHAFGYNYSFEDEMPWKELGWIFNIEHSWKSHSRFGRAMADNHKRLANMDCEKREQLYSKIYALFAD